MMKFGTTKRCKKCVVSLMVLLLVTLLSFCAFASDQFKPSTLLKSQSGEVFSEFENWKLDEDFQTSEKITFRFSHKKHGKINVLLLPLDNAQKSFSVSKSFNILYKSEAHKTTGLAVNRLMQELGKLIKQNDKGQFELFKAEQKTLKDIRQGRGDVSNLGDQLVITPPSATILLQENGKLLPDYAGFEFCCYSQNMEIIQFTFEKQGRGKVTILLEPESIRPDTFLKSRNFAVSISSDLDDEQKKLLEKVYSLINKNDDGRIILARHQATLFPRQNINYVLQGSPVWLNPAVWYVVTSGEKYSALLVMLFAVLAFGLLIPSLKDYFASLKKRDLYLFAAISILALLIRLLVPHRLVMAYGGYQLIEQALNFVELKKYGAGTAWFYSLLLKVIPGEGDGYLFINTITGWATLLLAAIWFGKIAKSNKIVLIALLLLALNPVLIKDHNSESNFIPTLFFFFSGLNLYQLFKEKLQERYLFFAVANLIMSIYCRPFFIIFVPFTLLIDHFFFQNTGKTVLKKLIKYLPLVFILLIFHVAFLYVNYLADSNTSHAMGILNSLKNSIFKIFNANLFIDPKFTPGLYLLLWLPAFYRASRDQLRLLLGVLALSLLFFVFYFSDAPEPSLPRLQVASTYFFCMISAVGFYRLQSEHANVPQVLRHPFVLILLLLVSYYWPASTLWQKSTDLEEHQALNELVKYLPKEPVLFVRFGINDAPATFGIFRDYPDYLFKKPRRDDAILSINDWWQLSDTDKLERETYIYLGSRCYALIDYLRDDSVTNDYYHPACQKVLDKVWLKVIWKTSIKNHELYRKFIWYPDRDTLDVGLYKVMKHETEQELK